MQNKKINNTFIFYVSYFLFLFANMFSTIVSVKKISMFIRLISIILLFIHIFLNMFSYRIKKSDFFKLTVCSLLMLIIYTNSKNTNHIYLMLLILSLKNVSFDDFLKKDFKFRLIFLLLVIFFYFLGLTNVENRFRDDGTIRYSLGFSHPNELGLNTLVLALSFIYLKKDLKRIFKIFILIILLMFNIAFTDSRATILSLLLTLIYVFFSRKSIKKFFNFKMVKCILKNGLLIFFLTSLTISICYQYNIKIINYLDSMFSSRISLANYYINNYSIFTLFGQELPSTYKYINGIYNSNFIALDNGYIHMLLENGWIYIFIILITYYCTVKKLLEYKKYELVTFLFIFLIYTLMELNAFVFPYNPFIFSCIISIYNTDNTKDKKSINLKFDKLFITI